MPTPRGLFSFKISPSGEISYYIKKGRSGLQCRQHKRHIYITNGRPRLPARPPR